MSERTESASVPIVQSSRPQPRVLVIRGGAIGDFILTLPAIRLLKQQIANAYLEVLGYAPIIELAKLAGLADQTRHLEHVAMSKLFVPRASMEPALMQYFRSFNLIVSYLFDPDGIVKSNLENLGVKTYLEMPHRINLEDGHATEQLARPLEKLAMFLEDPAPNLFATSHLGEKERADPDPHKLVAIHPGSGSLTKNWPLRHWLEVSQELLSMDPDLHLAWVTGEAEMERGMTAQVQAAHPEFRSRIQFWDQIPLTELANRLRRATWFLGHDSGMGHLAGACGIPGLLLFGPTDPQVWAPRNEGIEVYREPSGDLNQLTLADGKERLLTFSKRYLE